MSDRPTDPRRATAGAGHDAGRREEIAERRARALEEPLDVRRLPGPFMRLEVRNSLHGTHYTVLLPTYPSRDAALCTCTDFSRSGLGTCKHVEAAFRWLATHPEGAADPDPLVVEPAPSWSEIDARIRAVPPAASPAKRLRWSGEVLLEKPPGAGNVEGKEGVGRKGGRAAGSPRSRTSPEPP